MAKQKSGLGRGLNALFDDSPLNHTHSSNSPAEPSSQKEEKKAEFEQKAVKNDQRTVQDEALKTVSAAPHSSTSSNTSSDIYISEDALENAKVVSREARPKVNANGSISSIPHERSTSVFQHRSTASINHTSHGGDRADYLEENKPQVRDRNSALEHVANIKRGVQAISDANKDERKPSSGKLLEEKGMTGIVPLVKIEPNPDQPRTNFKPEEIEELASSIKKEGLLQPILVRKSGDHYQIIAGERRWQACKSLNMKEIPVRFWAADNDKALELALIENIQRSDLNPIEEAYGYKRLMERRGMTQSEVAQTVSKGRSTIANALRLLDLPEEAQQLLFEEKITAGHARAILSIPDAEGRKKLTEKLVNEKLSVRETEAIARLLSGRAKAQEEGKTKRVPAPASFKKAARGLTRFFSVPVKVKTVQGKNKIEIQFKDEDDLQRILNLIAEKSSIKED